jgi:hypothetical protein
MIKIYPSPFSDPDLHEPIYEAPVMPGETLEELVRRLVPSYDPLQPTPWSCQVNGMEVPPSRYAKAVLGPDTTVSFFLTPRGSLVGKLVNAVLNIFTLGAWSLVSKFMTPNVAKSGAGGGGSQDRDDMDLASVKANTVKQGGVIREKFGEGRIYPDHLVQMRRFFVDGQPERQACEMLLCLGRGRFLTDLARSKVGETTQSALGDNFVTRLYEPGADLTNEAMADNWFTSSEVGGTSSGTAGLELTVVSSVKQNAEVSTVVLSGNTVTVPSGAGTWPTGWAAGMIIRAVTPYAWTVTDGGAGLRDRITGPWDSINPVVGMNLEVAGDFSGRFIVESVVLTTGGAVDYVTLNFDNGAAATELPTGTANLAVGYAGLRFRIVAITPQILTLTRLTDTGANDPTWPGFASLNSASASFTLDQFNLESGWSGPMAACPEGEKTRTLEIDFFYPNGLYRTNEYGNTVSYRIEVEVQYREIGPAGPWTAVSYIHSGDKIAQIGFSPRIELPTEMRPEVRVRRLTPVTAVNGTSDKVQWYGLKSRLSTRANSYAGLSVAAARVFGGGALGAQAEQMVSYWVTRILPRRRGGQWLPEAPTRSIVDACMYLIRDRGYGDNRVDLAEWDRLGAIWDARQDYFDGSFEKETTAEAALNVILRAGYANITAPRGILRPARDAQRSAAEKAVARLYSPQNSTDIVRSGSPVNPNDADAVNVKWMNPVTWTLETVKCRVPGAPAPKKILEMTVEGVNDRTHAWRLGMRELMTIRYRRWRYTFSTGLDSFASAYMDYAELSDYVPELPSGGHLRYWDGAQTFVSNEPVQEGATVAVLRRPDGTKFGPYPITVVDPYTFTMAQPLDFAPIDETNGGRMPTHVFTGTITEEFWPVLVSSVAPSSQFRANVQALGYDERVYQFDNAEPPADA